MCRAGETCNFLLEKNSVVCSPISHRCKPYGIHWNFISRSAGIGDAALAPTWLGGVITVVILNDAAVQWNKKHEVPVLPVLTVLVLMSKGIITLQVCYWMVLDQWTVKTTEQISQSVP